MLFLPLVHLLLLSALSLTWAQQPDTQSTAAVEAFFNDNVGHASPTSPTLNHTNNWAVLVSASRYWFNYRVRSAIHLRSGKG